MTAHRALSDVERLDWLQLARTENVGPVTFHSLLQRFSTAAAALAALPELSRKGGRARPLLPVARGVVERELEQVQRAQAFCVVPGEAGYPTLLRHIHGAPPVLFVAGRRELSGGDIAAIVGARNASVAGLKFTRMLALGLTEAGYAVASGLARGIDTAAHEAALAGGTIAVVAGGLDHIYPPENAKLQQAVRERGLLVSEMPMGMVPKAEHFPRRNRIISGMARAVIVVEAALRSGSLITARYAGEQGRDVLAVPGSPLDPRAEGCNALIRDGAQIITSVADAVEAMRQVDPAQGQMFFEPPSPYVHDDVSMSDRERVVDYLSPTPVHVDELIRESRMAPEIISAILLELELAGRVVRSPGGRVALA